jgi:phospholipid/cholesterol/gamma-HCH transport system substrate-binding protein
MSKEVKVALLAVISLVVLYFGFNFLKGSDLFSSSNQYYAVYDNVDGLVVSNPVMLNGLSVGRVKDITILQARGNQLLVTIDIDRDIRLTKTSVASLADGGLLGGKLINLGIQPGAPLEDEDTLRSEKVVGLSTLLQQKASPVLDNADSLMRNLNIVTSKFKETGTILNQLLGTVDRTGLTLQATVNENRKAIAAMLTNLNTLSSSLIETEKELKPLLGKANTFADSLQALRLNETVNQANLTVARLQGLLQNLESGQGTMGKLLKDEKMYANLNQTLVDLDKLLVDFRQQPKRYVHFSVFGRKDKTGPGDTTGTGATKP